MGTERPHDGEGEEPSDTGSTPDLEFDEEFEVDEELEEEWLKEWAEADRDAVDVLREALADQRGAPPPPGLAEAAAAARAELDERRSPVAWVRRAADLENKPLPDADTELLIRCTAATISAEEDTGLEPEEEAGIMSLEHADWLGAIVSAVRGGPGADASPPALVDGLKNSPEINFEVEMDVDDEAQVETAFTMVELPWQTLGLVDLDERLTDVGAWVLPRALARAWSGDFDQEPAEDSG